MARVWICCQAVIPVMRDAGRGAIVNVSSVAGQRGGGLLGTSASSTSKGAVSAMTMAAVIAFLASEEASYVTGHVYNVDGGSAM